MKRLTTCAIAALGSAIALATIATADAQQAAKPSFKSEKCYGVAKAGGNDCETATSSCAGTSRRDHQADAWVYVPEGLCNKLAQGKLTRS
jgi:uncharacterized membrane protein